MGSSTQQHQKVRLDVRIATRHKNLIEQAAGLVGQTLSSFTVSTLVREAEQVVHRFGALYLSERDRDVFLAALDTPPKPNPRLRKASEEHTRTVAP